MDEPAAKPTEADRRSEDDEYNPKIEPRKSKAWLNMLLESEKAFENWNDHCDRIDKQYASLQRLSDMVRDKEFSMFWANMEVVKPSIYAKPPVPVVVPKFKDRRPVYQAASEVAERCAIVSFDLSHINDLMLLVRDDLAMISRGVAWCRYESGKGGGSYRHEKVCIDFKNRRDFLHSISRNWPEVTWVAAASYLTRSQARKRFYKHSGNAYQEAEYRVDKDAKEVGGADDRERAKFWEIWHRTEDRVLWVAHGVEDILDEDDPEVEYRDFFPCPKPAYGVVQRGSLVPVPDVLQYRDQLEELNLLTSRIHALSDALEAKGFYPAGGAELSDAVQAAIKAKTPGRMLVPISNWAAFGGSKEVIIWLPIDMIAQTITALVALRKEVIQDIYQIMGLADIMRGQSDPNETLGAQQLKQDNGSHRIKDKQGELVRLARDLVEISVEIIFQKFDPVTIIEMSQTQLPTRAMVQKEIMGIMQQVQQAAQQVAQLSQNPQMMQQMQQMAAQKPEMAKEVMGQVQKMQSEAQGKIDTLKQKPTIEQVLHFLKDNRSKSFVLDIETDSTIQADENAEKQRRTEFVGVLSQLLPQIAAMIGAEPSTAPFCGDLIKFAIAPFRAGRSLDGSIDELVEQMKLKGSQPKPDPETEKLKMQKGIEDAKLEAQKMKDQGELKVKQDELMSKEKQHTEKLANDRAIAIAATQGKQQEQAQKGQIQNEKLMQNRETHQAHMIEKQQDMQLGDQKARLAQEQLGMKRQDMQIKQADRQADQQFKQQDRQQEQQFKHQQAVIKSTQPQGPRQ